MTVDQTDALARRKALITALAESAGGDRRAFRHVYDMTAPKLFGICLRICGERQAAEDVLQEVYLIIWRRAGAYEPARGNPVTWLCTIARNRALDWRRARPLHLVASDGASDAIATTLPDDGLLAEQLLVIAEEHARLRHCVDSLDDRPRAAIRAAFVDGLTYAEVAERSATPLPTMKSMIRRALIRLRECLRDDG
ncbi:sigma-70 family RNA polymerase sigma factor [Sphingomonas sp. RHCKR47]|nr:sigma-70 family RNA polymerase sigma factor [Sphingomonas citricola]MBW6522773.1 sigma-70 family RNA polymerase sigma factor [Sphingomonas citricola]